MTDRPASAAPGNLRAPWVGARLLAWLGDRDHAARDASGDDGEPVEPESPEAAIHWDERHWERLR